jgi:sigma-B regulation protein RsbU (phosphoserine phosphatase)
MNSNQTPKRGGKGRRPEALTRGEAPPEIRPRSYINRAHTQRRTMVRGTRTAPVGYRGSSRRHSTNQLSRELDERVVELQALFEVSKTLNSSLQLKNILDTLLLTPMGKMMIGKGAVLLARDDHRFAIETLKGLPRTHLGQEIEIDLAQPTTQYLNESEGQPWAALLLKWGLRLVVPIISGNRCLGLMVFSNKLNDQTYMTNELEYLNSLANLAATAVENALIFQQLNEVNRRLDKKIQELNTLFEISKELNSTLESEKIVNVLAYALMGELMVQRCMIFTNENGQLLLRVNKGLRGEDELGLFQDEGFKSRLQQISQPVVTSQLVEDDLRTSLQNNGIMLIVPLLSQNMVRGVALLGEKITKGEFLTEDVEFSTTLCNAAMTTLENARLFQETIEKERLEEELAIAREIQQRLLPKEAPQLGDYEIAALNIPTHQVGGDYFDYFPIDSLRHAIAIADVSGKGVPAALIMSNLQATLHAMMTADVPFEQIVSRINNSVYRNTSFDKFITSFFAIFDRQTATLVTINAGHNPPYLFHADGSFETLQEGGLLLGMFPNAPYKSETRQLREGDWVVMYTDGVSEAMNAPQEEFGEKRIEEIIRVNLNNTAAGMIEAISKAVKDFTTGVPQSDDITLVALRCNCKASVEDGKDAKPSADQNPTPEVLTSVDQAHERYATLIDKKFQQSLTAEEQLELETIENSLDEAEKPYYEAIIQRLKTERDKLSKD